MPDDTNPSLDVTARLDPSNLVSGAGTAQGAIAGVSAATSEAAQVAAIYSTNLTTAERALVILGSSAGQATANMADLDAAMDLAQAEAVKAAQANAAYAESLSASAAEVIAAGEAQNALGTVTAKTARALASLSIEQSTVATTAAEMGLSMEVAALAMIKIERTQLATTVKEATLAMEDATEATVANTVATEADAEANALDAEAMAKRSLIMRRTSDGLVDVALGGRRAIQGINDLQYALGALFPEGTAVIGVIAGIALIGELWERMSQKMEKDHREATDKIKKATDETTENYKAKWKDAADEVAKSLKVVYDAQEDVRRAEEAQIGLINAKAELTKKQEELDKNAALLSLQQGYIEAQSVPGSDKEGLKRRYEASRKDIEGQTTVNTSADDLSKAMEDAAAATQAKAAQEKAVAENQKIVSDMTARQAEALKFVEQNYLVWNKDKGELTDAAGNNATTVAAGERDAAAKAFADAQQNGSPPHDIDAARAARDKAQAIVDSTSAVSQTLSESKSLDEAQKKLADSQSELTSTTQKLAEALAKVDQAGQSLSESQKQADLDRKQRAIDASDQFQKENAEGVRKNTDELVKRFREGQKKDAASKEKPLEEHLQTDRDAVTHQQEAIRQMADHAKAMGEQGKQHAQQTAQLAESMKLQLDQLREAVQRDEEALRQFKKQDKANAIQ